MLYRRCGLAYPMYPYDWRVSWEPKRRRVLASQYSILSGDPCLPCVIKLMTVWHFVTFNTRTSATAAGFARGSQLSSPRPGQAVRSVRAGGMYRSSQHKSHPAALVTLLQPARRASVLGHLSSLRLGLVGRICTKNSCVRNMCTETFYN